MKKKKRRVKHSRAFHRYFEGYCEHKVDRGDGTFGIERFYVGEYYRQDVSQRRRILQKTGFFLLYLLALALFVAGGTRPAGSNLFLGLIALQVAALCLLLRMLFLMLAYAAAEKEMKICTYRETSLTMKNHALALSVLMGALAAAAVLYAGVTAEAAWRQELLGAACYLLSGLSFLGIWSVERHTPYSARQSARRAEPEDVLIEY